MKVAESATDLRKSSCAKPLRLWTFRRISNKTPAATKNLKEADSAAATTGAHNGHDDVLLIRRLAISVGVIVLAAKPCKVMSDSSDKMRAYYYVLVH